MMRKNCIVLYIHHLIQDCFGKKMEEFLHQLLQIPKDYQLKEVIIENLKK